MLPSHSTTKSNSSELLVHILQSPLLSTPIPDDHYSAEMEIDAKQNVKDQADSTGLESNIGDRFGLLEPDTGNHTTIGKSLQDNSTKQFM